MQPNVIVALAAFLGVAQAEDFIGHKSSAGIPENGAPPSKAKSEKTEFNTSALIGITIETTTSAMTIVPTIIATKAKDKGHRKIEKLESPPCSGKGCANGIPPHKSDQHSHHSVEKRHNQDNERDGSKDAYSKDEDCEICTDEESDENEKDKPKSNPEKKPEPCAYSEDGQDNQISCKEDDGKKGKPIPLPCPGEDKESHRSCQNINFHEHEDLKEDEKVEGNDFDNKKNDKNDKSNDKKNDKKNDKSNDKKKNDKSNDKNNDKNNDSLEIDDKKSNHRPLPCPSEDRDDEGNRKNVPFDEPKFSKPSKPTKAPKKQEKTEAAKDFKTKTKTVNEIKTKTETQTENFTTCTSAKGHESISSNAPDKTHLKEAYYKDYFVLKSTSLEYTTGTVYPTNAHVYVPVAHNPAPKPSPGFQPAEKYKASSYFRSFSKVVVTESMTTQPFKPTVAPTSTQSRHENSSTEC